MSGLYDNNTINKANAKAGLIKNICFEMHIAQQPNKDSVDAVIAMSKSLIGFMEKLDKQLKG